MLFRRSYPAFLMAAAIVALAACVANPIKAAKTTQQTAFALYGEFVTYEKVAAKLVQDPTVPEAAKAVLRQADAKAYPAATALFNATQEVVAIQATLDAGQTTSDKLVLASANMETWYTQSKPLVEDLITSVSKKGAK